MSQGISPETELRPSQVVRTALSLGGELAASFLVAETGLSYDDAEAMVSEGQSAVGAAEQAELDMAAIGW